MPTITGLEVLDIRFPTSLELDGSDAMNPDPDYSAAYVQLRTDDGPDGAALAFTIGRGNEVVATAIAALRGHVVGYDVQTLCAGLGDFYRLLNNDSQLRWLGPEKGVMQMAIGVVVNAAWDLASRRAGLPLWRFMAELSPEQLVDAVDWRYLSDALTPDEALEMLKSAEPGRAQRITELLENGYPAYTTSPGWLGYTDEKMLRLAHEAVADGYTQIKLKVGGSVTDDVRRMRLTREALGPDIRIAVDANQRWDAAEAIAWMTELLPYDPYWIEEPTSPDDLLAHAAIRSALSGRCKVATGEHVQNRIIFKQMLLAGSIDILQVDAARVAGVNENIAILLLAAKFGIPVCPHAGGVGLCEMVQHLSMFDYVAITGTTTDRVIEYVDHLHEHFSVPTRIVNGHYLAPTEPGGGGQITDAALRDYSFPDGPVWQELQQKGQQ